MNISIWYQPSWKGSLRSQFHFSLRRSPKIALFSRLHDTALPVHLLVNIPLLTCHSAPISSSLRCLHQKVKVDPYYRCHHRQSDSNFSHSKSHSPNFRLSSFKMVRWHDGDKIVIWRGWTENRFTQMHRISRTMWRKRKLMRRCWRRLRVWWRVSGIGWVAYNTYVGTTWLMLPRSGEFTFCYASNAL